MNGASAVRNGPHAESVFEGNDFGVFARDLLLRLYAAHPNTVNLTGDSAMAIVDDQSKKIWSYLKYQEIVFGELTDCALTPSGHQSVQSVLYPKREVASGAEAVATTLAGQAASKQLLDVMRHHFAVRTNTL